jgi:hypothetical protein
MRAMCRDDDALELNPPYRPDFAPGDFLLQISQKSILRNKVTVATSTMRANRDRQKNCLDNRCGKSLRKRRRRAW